MVPEVHFFVIKITGKNCPKLGNFSTKLHETEKINATECFFAFFRLKIREKFSVPRTGKFSAPRTGKFSSPRSSPRHRKFSGKKNSIL